MRRRLRRVVVSGSECTGKTTLAAELARHFGTVASHEAARAYAERAAGALTAADVEPIARAQIAAEDSAAARAAHGIVVLDTDLVSTCVYARHYYGACPKWVEKAARERRADLYLLLHPDVPWASDGVRDRPRRRAELHALFAAALRALGARVVPIRGTWATRRHAARRAVERLIEARATPRAAAAGRAGLEGSGAPRSGRIHIGRGGARGGHRV